MATDEELEVAERVQAECLRAALEAYENAGLQGLCAEGRWEAAIDAIRTVRLAALLDAEHGRPTIGCGGDRGSE